MTDIAALGLSVESSQVETAASKLDSLAAASKRAERATKTFEAGNRSASASAGALGEAVKKATISAEMVNKRLNVRDNFNSRGRAADVDAYGQSLDDLRAKYNPLYAAERTHFNLVKSITGAQALGAIAQGEAALAILASEDNYKKQAAAIAAANLQLTGNTKSAALSANAMTNLSFQINDVATQAALGMDPLRILAAQGGQFYQILQQGEGGIRGSLGHIGSLVKGLITPFRLAVGGALTFAGTAAFAAVSWREAQHQIELALIGTGGAAGVTAAAINEIAMASARAGKTTVGDARDMALAFASTGKIGVELTGQLVGLSKGFGSLFGETAMEGAARLAKVFDDPAKGVDVLNSRLAAFDAATVQNIKSLTAQGNRFQAQRILIDGVKTATDQATAQTAGWANAWGRLTTKASEYLAVAGRALDNATGGGNSMESRLADAERRLAEAQRGRAGKGGGVTVNASDVAAAAAKVDELADALQRANRAAAEAPGNMRSLGYAAAIDAATPNVRDLNDAVDALEKLRSIRLDPAGFSGLPTDQQNSIEQAIQGRQEEVDSLRLKIQYQTTSRQIAEEDNAFALQSIAARTAGQKAEIAYAQTLAQERRDGNVNAEFAAAAAKAQVLAEASRAVTDEIRNRNFAAAQAVELAALEFSLVGKTADEVARTTAAFQARQGVLADAFQDNRTANPGELAAAENLARQKAEIESKTRRAQLVADLDFERAQIGRSQTDSAVYARMQAAGLLENGRITGAQNEAIAAQIRFNDQLQQSIEIQKQFASGILHDLMAGKSATEALGNALQNLASKMLDNSINHLFAGFTQAGLVPTGGALGGNILPGIFHAGGIVGNDNAPTRSVPASLFAGARRYHNGGVIGADEVPAILQKGERVLSRRDVAAGGGSGAVVINMTNNVNAQGAYPESIAQINARLDEIPGRVVRIVQETKSRKIA